MNWDEFVKKRWEWVKWCLIIICYTILALFSASRSIFQESDPDYGLILSVNLTDWYAWAILTPFIIWFIHKFTLENTSLFRKFLINIPASIVFTFIYLSIVHTSYNINPLINDRSFLSTLYDHYYFFVMCLAIFGVDYAFDYYTKFRERDLKTSQLEAKLAQAQLLVLKMQIHPHFLFNTLNAISALIHKDREAADRMIVHLSDMLRIILDNAGEQEVSLGKELEMLSPYLEIEKTRFSDKLVISTDIEPETRFAKVPNLLLQPLVENAIKHGIALRTTGGAINISAKKENGKLQIRISDNGKGLPPDDKENIKEGIGISNTRARLAYLYSENHTFSIENNDDGGVIVNITIPFVKIES